MSLEYKFESLDGTFPRDLTAAHRRDGSPFGKTWTQVQEILERELRALNYRRGSVVLQTAHSPWDVRKDGKLRSDVRRPEHPGIVLKFDVLERSGGQSRYVQMALECDRFTEWKANIRAVADALEALRKVNRYGVSGGGKTEAHYEGYKALPAADGSPSTVHTAADFIAAHSGFSRSDVLSNFSTMAQAYRKAAQKLHPDAGGNNEKFIELQKAKQVLETHFN